MDSPEGRAAEVPPRGGDCNVGECGENDSERINGPDGASACVEPLCFVGRHEKRCGQHFEGFGVSAGSSWSFHRPSVGVEGSFVARSRGGIAAWLAVRWWRAGHKKVAKYREWGSIYGECMQDLILHPVY